MFKVLLYSCHSISESYVPEDARSDAAVAFDGKYRRELHRGDSVQIQMSSYPGMSYILSFSMSNIS